MFLYPKKFFLFKNVPKITLTYFLRPNWNCKNPKFLELKCLQCHWNEQISITNGLNTSASPQRSRVVSLRSKEKISGVKLLNVVCSKNYLAWEEFFLILFLPDILTLHCLSTVAIPSHLNTPQRSLIFSDFSLRRIIF